MINKLFSLVRFFRTDKMYHDVVIIDGTTSDSLQLHPFLKWDFLLKERFCSQWE